MHMTTTRLPLVDIIITIVIEWAMHTVRSTASVLRSRVGRIGENVKKSRILLLVTIVITIGDDMVDRKTEIVPLLRSAAPPTVLTALLLMQDDDIVERIKSRMGLLAKEKGLKVEEIVLVW